MTSHVLLWNFTFLYLSAFNTKNHTSFPTHHPLYSIPLLWYSVNEIIDSCENVSWPNTMKSIRLVVLYRTNNASSATYVTVSRWLFISYEFNTRHISRVHLAMCNRAWLPYPSLPDMYPIGISFRPSSQLSTLKITLFPNASPSYSIQLFWWSLNKMSPVLVFMSMSRTHQSSTNWLMELIPDNLSKWVQLCKRHPIKSLDVLV